MLNSILLFFFRQINVDSVSQTPKARFPPVSSRQTSRQLARLQRRYVPSSRLQSALSGLHSKMRRLNSANLQRFSTGQNAC